jgi:predicted O-methyltransferase YrrM
MRRSNESCALPSAFPNRGCARYRLRFAPPMKKLKNSLVRFVSRMWLFRYIARKAGYVEYNQHVPPGHFYSPIADPREIDQFADQVFNPDRRTLPAIDLREKEQLALAETLARYYPELPFAETKKEGLRYYYGNDLYCHSDAIFLYAMMRHFRPKRIIEAGSGFSSAVMLDTNDLFLDGTVQLEFVEPFPERLYSLLTPKDRARAVIHEKKLQEMPVDYFAQLEANDILFIDSSHVTRVAGEVNYYMFEILPALRPGVLVHIHDIFNGFEYPRRWIKEGKSWSEAYLLRAFLEYNSAFEILLFNTYLAHFHRDFFQQQMPLCLQNTGGSIWLRKVG